MSLIGTSVLVNWGGVLEKKEIDYNQWGNPYTIDLLKSSPSVEKLLSY